jgi:hypothetical protein
MMKYENTASEGISENHHFQFVHAMDHESKRFKKRSLALLLGALQLSGLLTSSFILHNS